MPSILGAFSLRPLGALSRIRCMRDGARVDLLELMSLSSNTPAEHEMWCRAAGVDPAVVGTVWVGSRSGLARALGRVSKRGAVDTKTIGSRLEEWGRLRLAALRRGVLFIFIPHIIKLDPNARPHERAVEVPWRWAEADESDTSAEMGGQPDLPLGGSAIDPIGIDPSGIGVQLYRDQEEAEEGARAAGLEGFAELARMAEDSALPLANGRPYRLTTQAARRLAAIAQAHGVEACRAAFERAEAVTHPVGWLDAVLSESEPAEPDELDPLEGEVLACIPPVEGRPPRRRLADAERELLAALIAAHGDEAVRAAIPAAAGWSLPIRGIEAALAGTARRGMGRADPREQRRRAEVEVGRHRVIEELPPPPPPPPTPDPEAEVRWGERREALRQKVAPENWLAYIATLVAVGVADDGAVLLEGVDPLAATWAAAHFGELLAEHGARIAAAPEVEREAAEPERPPGRPLVRRASADAAARLWAVA